MGERFSDSLVTAGRSRVPLSELGAGLCNCPAPPQRTPSNTHTHTSDPQGAATNLCKLAPAAGISWFTFEECKYALGVDVRS